MNTIRGLTVALPRSDENVALIAKAREAFADGDDLCIFCGDHWSDHLVHLGRKPDGTRDILRVLCCHCPGEDGTMCWQRPGLE